jgi:hypothetical protein
MAQIDLSEMSKELRFPELRPIPMAKSGLWERIKDFFTFRRKWEVVNDEVFWCPYFLKWVFIPRGFVFDGASVPKAFNAIYTPTGILFYGSIFHDFGYEFGGLLHVSQVTGQIYFQEYSRSELDRKFQRDCEWESGMKLSTKLAQTALSVGAWPAWNGCRKENQKINQRFPELICGA